MLMRDEIKGSIEAVLFINSERMELSELEEILKIPAIDLQIILDEMILEYNRKERGIQIIKVDDGYLMCTKRDYADILARVVRPVYRRLSTAALEVLAIIAYRQPITRIEIDALRGVKSDRVIRNLLEKELIKEAGYRKVPGKPLLYVTSSDFLKVFGLSSLDELPAIEGDPDNV